MNSKYEGTMHTGGIRSMHLDRSRSQPANTSGQRATSKKVVGGFIDCLEHKCTREE